jgi:hypothetical protein
MLEVSSDDALEADRGIDGCPAFARDAPHSGNKRGSMMGETRCKAVHEMKSSFLIYAFPKLHKTNFKPFPKPSSKC